MSRHISTLNYQRSAATCLTRTRTVICWLSAPGITDSVNKCRYFRGHCRPKSPASLTFDRALKFSCCHPVTVTNISHRKERTTWLHHLNACITFVFEITYLVLFEFFHAMSTKITVPSLDQRMKVMTFAMESGNLSMIDGIVNLQTIGLYRQNAIASAQ